jgi:hypothetical protein
VERISRFANLLLKLKTPRAQHVVDGTGRRQCALLVRQWRQSARDHAEHGAVKPSPSPTAAWGVHLVDANVALGNLNAIVAKETAAYVAHRGR